jgi:dihydroflavonol-4-reductase
MPDWVLRTLAPFSKTVRSGLGDMGAVRRASAEKARLTLGWNPIPREESVFATVDSLYSLNPE